MTEAMLWTETNDEKPADIGGSDAVVDLSFAIHCAQLPVDHAWQLHRAIARVLPWIGNEPHAAIHSIHGAASGNGWTRPPDEPGGRLQLSKRTRLCLRLPKHRTTHADQLSGHTLDIGDHPLEVGRSRIKLLSPSPTLFARSVVMSGDADAATDEGAFSQRLADDLILMHIRAPKLLCGLVHKIARAQGSISARSVLLADLTLADSIRLQQNGVGANLSLGCGIFLPHKHIGVVPRMGGDD